MLVVNFALLASFVLWGSLSYDLILRSPDLKQAQSRFLIPLSLCMFVPIAITMVSHRPELAVPGVGVTWIVFLIYYLWRSRFSSDAVERGTR
jgi:hypothetical protein